MKKLMLLAAGIVASMLFAGCAVTPAQSPAQIAAALCPATNNAITLITTFNATLASTVPAAANANNAINTTVKPIVSGVCAAGATISRRPTSRRSSIKAFRQSPGSRPRCHYLLPLRPRFRAVVRRPS